MAAAAALLLALPLGWRQFQATQSTDFYVLADPARTTGDVRLVFSKPLPPAEIGAMLREIGGSLVEGPNSMGAYAIRLGEDGKLADMGAALAYLRRQEAVVLAEPIQSKE